MTPIQCNRVSDSLMMAPPSARSLTLCSTAGAAPAEKKMMPPSQMASESTMRNRRKFIWLLITELHRHRDAFHNVAQNLLALLGYLERGGIAGVHHHAMREGRHSQLLEVFRSGEVAAF